MENWFNLLPILLIAITCILLISTDDWKKALLFYGIIIFLAFLILIQFWSFSSSLVKFLTGIMSLLILSLSINRNYQSTDNRSKSEMIFYSVALCLIFLIVIFVSKRISDFLSIPLELIISSLFISGYGILQLGMTQKLYKVFLALLLFFFGFELIYSINESSLLVNGLLAMVSLLVALIGGYLLAIEYESVEE
jgi:hypothetical protein